MNVIAAPTQFDFSNVSSLALDIATAKPKDLLCVKESFEAYVKTNPQAFSGPLPVVTGWNDIDPTKALFLLSRNRPGANRKIDPATVYFYARQMKGEDWKATGQPVLIDAEGRLTDAQHRLWACVVSGATFRTYVVTEVPVIVNGFAYIDSSRPRNAAAALQTSGLNGVSGTIAKVIKLAEEVRLGVYDPKIGADSLPRMSPAEFLAISGHYPNAQDAARSAQTDWAGASNLVGMNRKDIVAYLGMRIIDLYGHDTAEDFFELVGDIRESGKPSDDPIVALHKAIARDRSNPTWRRHHLLAAMTKTFNAWRAGEPLKGRWMLQVDEAFPLIVEPTPQEEEAA